jgi:hypothetical protein
MTRDKEMNRLVSEAVQGSKTALEEIIRYEAKGWFSKQQDIPQAYLEAETRSVCTHAILLCLDRTHRMAFILGVVMEVSSREGGQVLGISASAYRKRLSRARSKIKEFLVANCSLFNTSNTCRCSHILPAYLEKGWIDPDKPIFIPKKSAGETTAKLTKYLQEMDDLRKLSFLYNSIPTPDFDFVDVVKDICRNNEYHIVSDP